MADMIYMTLSGEKQGLISSGCSSAASIGNKYQSNHTNEILVFSLTHSITRGSNANHHPFVIQKPIDKSSPLLGVAISNNELLNCILHFYRTNPSGAHELYYKIELRDATITELSPAHYHSVNHNELPPQESISLKYKSITWNHISAGTSGYSIWEDQVF